MATLPTGRRGQALALALLAATLGALWLGAAVPLLDWHGERAALLQRQLALASRMQAVAEGLPRLRQEAAGTATGTAMGSDALLEGGSDAVAGAALQAAVEGLARGAGTTISSTELLPAEAAGAHRRIGLRLSASGPYPALVRLLQQIDQASPRMLVDDLQVQVAPSLMTAEQPLAAVLTVIAFRAGTPG